MEVAGKDEAHLMKVTEDSALMQCWEIQEKRKKVRIIFYPDLSQFSPWHSKASFIPADKQSQLSVNYDFQFGQF